MLYGWKENTMLTNCLAPCTHLSSTVSQLFESQVQKITIFTYSSPHFCFPWRRLCDYHAILHEWKDNSMLAKPLAACTHLSLKVSQLLEPQLQKIAIFTYCSPHFCFPWRRPCDYDAKCSIDGKTIQCLPNASQHVPIYLQ